MTCREEAAGDSCTEDRAMRSASEVAEFRKTPSGTRLLNRLSPGKPQRESAENQNRTSTPRHIASIRAKASAG